MTHLPVTVKFIKDHPNAQLPTKGSEGAAGFDLYAAETTTLRPGQHCLMPTGLRIALPKGYEAQVRPRSGLAYKHGVTVLNAPGTIDEDYRGPLGVILVNHSDHRKVITAGDRIAQLVVKETLPAIKMTFVEDFDETDRGQGGFGSTGQ